MEKAKGMVVLVTGPAGVGKDSVISEMIRRDSSLRLIPKYTNRPLRQGELGRLYASDQELDAMERTGNVIVVKNRFGIRIGEPISAMRDMLRFGLNPVTDYFIREVLDFKARIGTRVFTVYLKPPTPAELWRRLEISGRTDRFKTEMQELTDVTTGRYSGEIDLMWINQEITPTALKIIASIGAESHR